MRRENLVSDVHPTPGWRYTKKAKTRRTIQREALRLFKEHGYSATTVEQIAQAAEVSRITFFRYFSAKADVVLDGIIDEKVPESFLSQPPQLSPTQALRNALRESFLTGPTDTLERLRERHLLLRTVPELRTATLNHFAGKIRLISTMIAERVGRSPEDFAVRNLAGAIAGVWLAAWVNTEDDLAEGYMERYHQLLDGGLAHLEAGLPL